jgi:hypothetical protein
MKPRFSWTNPKNHVILNRVFIKVLQLGAGNQGVATGDALSFDACSPETQTEPENGAESNTGKKRGPSEAKVLLGTGNWQLATAYASQDQ